jgi:hypothetical protein
MQTAGGHSFTLDDKDSNAKLTVIKDYITKTGGNLSIDVKGDASINVNGSTDINSKGPASLSSASTVTIKGSSVAIN